MSRISSIKNDICYNSDIIKLKWRTIVNNNIIVIKLSLGYFIYYFHNSLFTPMKNNKNNCEFN
jgi:hypothetical protein